MTDYTKTAHAMTTKLQELISECGLQNSYGLATDKLQQAVKEYLDAANKPTFYEIAVAVMDSNTEGNCIFQVNNIDIASDGWLCHGVVIRRAMIARRDWFVDTDLKVTEK